MDQITFKQFHSFITEQEAQLDEGFFDLAKAAAKAAGEFAAKFKRKPTPHEAFAIRRALEQAKKSRAAITTRTTQAPEGSRVTRTPTAASSGRAAEREWIQQLVGD